MHGVLLVALAGQLAFAPRESPCIGVAPMRTSAIRQAATTQARTRRKRRSSTRSSSSARCTNFQILQRREALLHDLLIRARTETPQFEDQSLFRLSVGVVIGPVIVTRDFVGSPIIRARVTSRKTVAVSFVLSAQLTSKDGRTAAASTVVFLHPYETRSIELLCPDTFTPQSLTWSTLSL
jgi:hypothetical protein